MKPKSSDYADFYRQLTTVIRRHPRGQIYLDYLNRSITYLMYGIYPLLLIILFLENGRAALPFLYVPAVSFVGVSLVRKWLNQPRPYEVWDIVPLIAKDSPGEAMPSRHVFSATMISMCVWQVSWPLGLVCLLLSAVLACCRVLGGVHYPKDVLVGMAVGLCCGLMLIMF